MTDDITDDRMLSEARAAKLMGVHVNTLKNWRKTGQAPQHWAYPTGMRYRRTEVEAWVAERRRPAGTTMDAWRADHTEEAKND